jgi:hypothetical protein
MNTNYNFNKVEFAYNEPKLTVTPPQINPQDTQGFITIIILGETSESFTLNGEKFEPVEVINNLNQFKRFGNNLEIAKSLYTALLNNSNIRANFNIYIGELSFELNVVRLQTKNFQDINILQNINNWDFIITQPLRKYSHNSTDIVKVQLYRNNNVKFPFDETNQTFTGFKDIFIEQSFQQKPYQFDLGGLVQNELERSEPIYSSSFTSFIEPLKPIYFRAFNKTTNPLEDIKSVVSSSIVYFINGRGQDANSYVNPPVKWQTNLAKRNINSINDTIALSFFDFDEVGGIGLIIDAVRFDNTILTTNSVVFNPTNGSGFRSVFINNLNIFGSFDYQNMKELRFRLIPLTQQDYDNYSADYLTFKIVKQFNPYVQLLFLNSLGGWECFNFNAHNADILEFELFLAKNKNFSAKSADTLQINAPFSNNAEYQTLKELVESPQIYYVKNGFIPVSVIEADFSDNFQSEKAVNLTIRFKEKNNLKW